MGHTHRTEKSSRYEPETLHSKLNGGLSVKNKRDEARKEREREKGGRIRGRFRDKDSSEL